MTLNRWWLPAGVLVLALGGTPAGAQNGPACKGEPVDVPKCGTGACCPGPCCKDPSAPCCRAGAKKKARKAKAPTPAAPVVLIVPTPAAPMPAPPPPDATYYAGPVCGPCAGYYGCPAPMGAPATAVTEPAPFPCYAVPPFCYAVPPPPPVLPCAAGEAAPKGGKSARAYVVRVKRVEVRPGERDRVRACPLLKCVEGHEATLQLGGSVTLKDGLAQDLDGPAAAGAEQVPLGSELHVKVTGLDKKEQVRLDLALDTAEVEKVGKKGMVLMGSGLRAVQQIHLGKVVKYVLEKDDQGAARSRVEVMVKEAND
jgi:hypothetical protein